MTDMNRFLDGPFAPVAEEVTAFDLPVTGQVPAGLNGRYLRNGPNPMGLDDPNYHWFLGDGMVHGVRLRDGRAEWYRNRWVRSQAVAKARGETWPAAPVHEGMDFAANTHVIANAGRTLATVESGPLPYELADELDTVGPCDFGGTLPGGFAAHTKADPATGELHAVAYYWAWDHVQHVVVGPGGQVTSATNIPLTDGPDDARLRADRPLRRAVRSAGHVQHGRGRRPGRSCRTRGTPSTRPASACCPATAARPTSGGSTSTHAGSSTPSTPTTTTGRVVVDLCRYEGAYDVSTLDGPRAADPRPLDRRPGRREGHQQRLDDRLPGVPPGRRPDHLPAAPLRLQRGDR